MIFNFETLHAALGEMIVGGVVVETGGARVVENVRKMGGVRQRKEDSAGGASGVMAAFSRGAIGEGAWGR